MFVLLTVQGFYGSTEGKLQRVFDMNTCYADHASTWVPLGATIKGPPSIEPEEFTQHVTLMKIHERLRNSGKRPTTERWRKILLAFFLNREITPIGFRSCGVPIARLFINPSLKKYTVKRIARLLGFGVGGHPSHGTCIARLKKIEVSNWNFKSLENFAQNQRFSQKISNILQKNGKIRENLQIFAKKLQIFANFWKFS